MGRRRTEILIDNIVSKNVDGFSRVEAKVLGSTIWFESPDICLQPRAEAFASALLIPALHAGARLRFTQPLDKVWQANCKTVVHLLERWWGYSKLPPIAPTMPTIMPPQKKRAALCFSGGVDSFYTLLRSGEEIDELLTIFGFDMKIDDQIRIKAVEKSVREVAVRLGKRVIFVSTNLRAHPLVERVSWERSHGGATAAIGFLLASEIDRLLISASIDHNENQPWGSHWELDHRWSSSDLQVINYGSELRRVDKLTAIAGESILWDHLRVCWENRTPVGNCSRCQKCLNTRLVLADCSELDHYSVLLHSETLINDLRDLPSAKGRLKALHEVVARRRLSVETLDEVKALIERSRPATERANNNRMKLVHKLRELMGRFFRR